MERVPCALVLLLTLASGPLTAGTPPPPGDCDGDLDVDPGDHEAFLGCFSGADTAASPACACVDFDADTDVDCEDWVGFRAAWSGEGAPPAHPVCDPGRVPADIRVDKTDPTGTRLDVVWNPSCSTAAVDYAIYEGLLGDWTSHEPVTCDTGGATSGTIDASAGDRYYLVVPNTAEAEGSHGVDGLSVPGNQRPRGAVTCAVNQALGCQGVCDVDRCSGHGTCAFDAASGLFQGCECDAGWEGESCGECWPALTGPQCDQCAAGYVDDVAQCDDCAPGYHQEHRLPGAELEEDPDSTPPPPFQLHNLHCEEDETCDDVVCSSFGTCVASNGSATCACDPGYTGPDCSACATGYEPDRTGACTLGAECRAELCHGKGDCALDSLGNLVCQCDPGLGGADCGGPDIVVSGPDTSIYQGQEFVFTASGGSGQYLWTIESGPGSLVGGVGTPDVRYVADFTAPETVIVVIGATDSGSGLSIKAPITVIPPDCLPISGLSRPELVSFDVAMCNYMKGRGIRAGTLAVAKDGVPLYHRGYGFMDSGNDQDPFVHHEDPGPQVPPNALIRMGSVTKPMTSAAVRLAMEQEGVEPNFPALPYIEASMGGPIPWSNEVDPLFVETEGVPPEQMCPDWPNSMPDSRWGLITIEQLIEHRGGLDRSVVRSARWVDKEGPFAFVPPGWNADFSRAPSDTDPYKKAAMAIHDLEAAIPGNNVIQGPYLPDVMLKYMAGHCLTSNPGTEAAYSNFGFIVLGRVLEGIKGQLFSPEPVGTLSRPEGWGPYVDILRDLLDDYGVEDIYGAATFENDTQDREPYYRSTRADGSEKTVFNVADPFGYDESIDEMGFNGFVTSPYGGWHHGTWDSAAGLIGSGEALLAFMKQFWTKTDGGVSVKGARVQGDRNSGWASHGGHSFGARALAWQMGYSKSCHDDKIGIGCLFDSECGDQNACVGFNCQRRACDQDEDCPDGKYSHCVDGVCNRCRYGCDKPFDDPDSRCDFRIKLPQLVGRWDQTTPLDEDQVVLDTFNCPIDTGVDVALQHAQSLDQKSPTSPSTEYVRRTEFLKFAACQVTEWPGPIPACPVPPCFQIP
jgi:CubicO group peptidase (beta-lactamase class C family)